MKRISTGTGLRRRAFLTGTGAAVGAIALAARFGKLYARQIGGDGRRPEDPGASPYGPLFPTTDETTGLPLLLLPRGFRYASLGWTGDLMSDGTLTPGRHDGMSIVSSRGKVTLIRNH